MKNLFGISDFNPSFITKLTTNNEPTFMHVCVPTSKLYKSIACHCHFKITLTLPFQNRPFPSSKKSHFQNEAKCEAIDMKMIFNYYANKTHFHNKGFALSLVLKVRYFGTRKCNTAIKCGTSCQSFLVNMKANESEVIYFCWIVFNTGEHVHFIFVMNFGKFVLYFCCYFWIFYSSRKGEFDIFSSGVFF